MPAARCQARHIVSLLIGNFTIVRRVDRLLEQLDDIQPIKQLLHYVVVVFVYSLFESDIILILISNLLIFNSLIAI